MQTGREDITKDVTVVPETLSTAQHDMHTRNPGPGADRMQRIKFHRCNADWVRAEHLWHQVRDFLGRDPALLAAFFDTLPPER
ncbi:hypothetical protein [Amycolatopsis sp. NPDC004625]|uniref:hypothetical protein n=1 Tax=Amycolatopsis sp. NPDC004625 TaxID=3154670 RepID=UPI0033B283A4